MHTHKIYIHILGLSSQVLYSGNKCKKQIVLKLNTTCSFFKRFFIYFCERERVREHKQRGEGEGKQALH